MPIAAFLLGDGAAGVKGRVRRLLDLAGGGVQKQSVVSPVKRWMTRSAWLSWILLTTLLLVHFSALSEMHDAIEHAVRFLS
jgi:hypothetical protein